MAEFLHILSEQYDYPQLADEVLRYCHSDFGVLLLDIDKVIAET